MKHDPGLVGGAYHAEIGDFILFLMAVSTDAVLDIRQHGPYLPGACRFVTNVVCHQNNNAYVNLHLGF